MTQNIASEEASSEYYKTIAPGFMGFYDHNFGYDTYGEGTLLHLELTIKYTLCSKMKKPGKPKSMNLLRNGVAL